MIYSILSSNNLIIEETNLLSQLFKLVKKVSLTIISLKFVILLLLKQSTITLLFVILVIADVSYNDKSNNSLISSPLLYIKFMLLTPRALSYFNLNNLSSLIGEYLLTKDALFKSIFYNEK